jgi:hypothetical protein
MMKKKLSDALAKVFHKNQYCGEKKYEASYSARSEEILEISYRKALN